LIALFRTHEVDDAPTQYAFDYVDTDGLLNELSVDHGDLVGRHGARYRVLYLGKNTSEMTVPTLRRLSDIATAGATIVGVAPASSPSLADKGSEFASLVGKLWSGDQVTKVGAGRVIAERDVEVALSQAGLAPDLAFVGLPAGDRILFVHRRLPDGDVYYLTNRSTHTLHTTARFRVTGKAPEIWRADDASRTPVSYRMTGETTQVPLTIAANDSFFVVFRKSTSAQARTVPLTAWRPVAILEGGWDVRFDGIAAPRPQHFERLHSLTQSADPATKYFSGCATYRKIFRLPAGIVPGSPVKLSLGAVGDVAEVRVNGQMMGTVWRAPYDLDIGAALRSGDNRIDIKVADLWVNRLIGDAQPAATKVTYTSFPTYEPTAPLRPAGLMGPVMLKTARVTTCAWMTATDKGPSACR
jgi:hypothetical protein